MMLLQPGMLGKWIAEHQKTWQMDFLDAGGLARFVADRGINGFTGEAVHKLWQLGLLRADLVISSRKLRLAGFTQVGTNQYGQHMYADDRRPRRRKKGWANAAESLNPLPPRLTPLFHPFRYYVLYRLSLVLQLQIGPMQMLFSVERYPDFLQMVIRNFARSTAQPSFLDKLDEWNNTTALAVATEPCAFTPVFGILRWILPSDEATQRRNIEKHWDRITKAYQQIGIKTIEEVRKDLCVMAEMLDPNKTVHTIIRLTRGKKRFDLKGRLGGAICLLTMAEMVRRGSERAFNTQLREEDELGFGWAPPDLKKSLYASNHLLDGGRAARDFFMQQHGLSYGVRLRWYVEGSTEYGAIASILEDLDAIEVINLRGKVAQRKELAFRESLKHDLHSRVFSMISIDGDRPDFIRVVRKAAREGLICGRFFVSQPDFEFENFTLSELTDILWDIAKKKGAKPDDKRHLIDALRGVASVEQLMAVARQALSQLKQVSKGEEWGRLLGEFARRNPEVRSGNSGATKLRPFLEAISIAVNATQLNYLHTFKSMKVDPTTGRLVKKQSS